MNGFADFRHDHPRPAALISALLAKVSKHMALLGCLMILGKASGRLEIGEVSIFVLIASASVMHLCGRLLAPEPSQFSTGRP